MSVVHWSCFAAALVIGCTSSGDTSNASSAPGSVQTNTVATATGGAQNSAPAPTPYVFFEPGDLSTSTGSTVPRAALSLSYGIDRAALIGDIRKHLSLKTWPELGAVDVPMMVTGDSADNIATRGVTFFAFSATAPLADRWYAIVLDRIPAGVDVPAAVEARRNQDGTVMSRFRPGSEAVLRRVRYCDPTKKNRLLVEFSEPVVASAMPIALVSEVDAPVACTAMFAPGSPAATIQYNCTADLTALALTLKIGTGFANAATGLAVASSTLSFTPQGSSFDGTCYVTRP